MDLEMAVFRHPCGWRQQAGPNKRFSLRAAAEDPEDERPGQEGRTNRGPGNSHRKVLTPVGRSAATRTWGCISSRQT